MYICYMSSNRREIPGLNGFYANIYGHIQKKVDYGFEFIPINKVGNGYRGCYICGKEYKVSKLIAMTFPEICGELFEGCDIDHINTMKTDDSAYNFKVCTHGENMRNPITQEHVKEAVRIWNENGRKPKSKSRLKRSKVPRSSNVY